MKILITGGTGFVGSACDAALTKRGHETVRFDLYPPKNGSLCNFIQGDVRDAEALDRALEGVDAVVHLAAAHHDFGIEAKTYHDVNVHGTATLCAAMQRKSIRTLMFYSTVAIYGENETPPTEETPPNPQTPYGSTKLGAEQEIKKWCGGDGANRALIIRPTVIFGPENFANMYSLIRQIESGKFFRVGAMSNIKSLAYIGNIINASLELWLDKQVPESGSEAFNYVDLPDLSSWEIVSAVCDRLGKKRPRFLIPYFLARALVLPFDIVIAITGRNLPVSSARIRKLALAHTQVDASKIHAIAGSNRLSVVQGIEKMVDWYREGGKSMQNENRRPPAEIQRAQRQRH